MRVNYFNAASGNSLKSLKVQNEQETTGKIIHFTGKNPSSEELSDVIKIANQVSQTSLENHLNALAGPETEGRGVGQIGIEKAKEYIADKFKEYGLIPVKELGLDNYYETFKIPQYPVYSSKRGPYNYGSLDTYDSRSKNVVGTNVLGMIKGSEKPDEYIIVCGHYDHLGKDMDTNIIYPGANDDASGVVSMLETARIISKGTPPKKSIIFAALTGEESGWLGANQLSKDLVAKGLAKKVEVLNVEMIAPVKGNKLDIWDQKMPEAKNMVDNITKAASELGVKVKVNHKVDPGSDSIRFSTYDIPAVCMLWDWDDFKWVNHPTYHCAEDTPQGANKKIFYEAARIAAASSYLIANDTAPKYFKPQSAKQIQRSKADREEALRNRKPL